MARLVILAALVLSLLPGCSTGRGAESAPAAQTAAAFGEVTLPPGALVLATATDSGIDTRYQLAVQMNAAQLREFLVQFPVQPVRSDKAKVMKEIAGPDLGSAPAPLYVQDRVPTAQHGTVTRDIVVDERAPDRIYVHLSFFTT